MTLAAGGGGEVASTLATIVVLAIGSQWIAWRLRVPSILVLLLCGFIVGPIVEWIFPGRGLSPDDLFGDLLTPAVGVAVGLILFEGGLTLKLREIRGVARSVALLVTVGSVCTWFVAAAAAYVLLDLSASLAILVGAILIVTGPTVIGPLLAHVRPKGQSGAILRWEGIVIDPIGVLMAVLVFEAILAGQSADPTPVIIIAIVKTIVVGGGLGWLGAVTLMWMIKRYWVPDFLQSPVALMFVVALVTVSNAIQEESGLLTATLMGIVLANQKRIDIHKILEFKENLRVLLLSALFILLAARLRIDQLQSLNAWGIAGFLVVLIVVARPLGVWLSTIGTGLSWREKVFMALMAPRGIVAAAGASLFALSLEPTIPEAGVIVPIVFAVIVGTVAFYGIASSPIARRLGVSNQNPQGVLFVGGVSWVRDVAKLLIARGIPVLVVDTNRQNVRNALMANIPGLQIDVLGEYALEQLDLNGIGRVCATTPNDEVNALVAQKFVREFGKSEVYQLPARAIKPVTRAAPTNDRPKETNPKAPVKPATKTGTVAQLETDRQSTMVGRHLFSAASDSDAISRRLASGHVWKATTLSDTFDIKNYRTLYGADALICFIVSPGGLLTIASADREPKYEPGQTLISVVDPDALLMGYSL